MARIPSIPTIPTSGAEDLGVAQAARGAFVSDTFTGSGELSLHTGETGATWVQHGSSTDTTTIIAATGWLRPTTTNLISLYYASGTPPTSNYKVAADIKFLAGVNGHASVCGRMDTAANTFYMGRYYSVDGEWQVYKFVAGVATKIISSVASLVITTVYHVELSMNDTTISLVVDGVSKGSVTDSAISAAGRVGVRTGSASTVNDTNGPEIDNLIATPL